MESQVCNYRKLVQDTLATCGTTKVSVVAMDEVPLQFLPKGINSFISTVSFMSFICNVLLIMKKSIIKLILMGCHKVWTTLIALKE